MDIRFRARLDELQHADRFVAHHDNGYCGRKVRHHSRSAAQTTRRAMLVTRPGAERLGVYACSLCDGWHVGHSPDPEVVPSCRRCRHHAYSHQWAAVARIGCALCECGLTRDEIYIDEIRRLRALWPKWRRFLESARGIFRR